MRAAYGHTDFTAKYFNAYSDSYPNAYTDSNGRFGVSVS